MPVLQHNGDKAQNLSTDQTLNSVIMFKFLHQTLNFVTMFKFLAVITLVAASASARQVTCDDCKSGIVALNEHLTGEESITEQIAILIAAYCPTTVDPAACEEGVAQYWPGIAKVLYGFFFTQKEPCGEMGMNVCKSTTPRDWTCQECADAIGLISNIMTEESYVQEAVVYLSGPAYCGDGGVHFDNCPEAIADVIPPILAVLSQAIIAQTESLCQDVLGVC